MKDIQLEKERVKQDLYRLHYHLMPPLGSLADPNGMCQIDDIYHIYYVHNPMACLTTERTACVWGHYSTKDFIHYKEEEYAIMPDTKWDKDGVYSGSSLYESGKLYVYYTGNVRYVGNYDYILDGREQNVMMVTSGDGTQFTDKCLLMMNQDYPDNMTKHVRDPQVFKEDHYYMVLGARNRENKGLVLIYESQDKVHWNYVNQLTTSQKFGFMWECPDLIAFNQKYILITCPQGIPQSRIYQNQHQCGYFEVEGDFRCDSQLGPFELFDYGFDFYAARTFLTNDGKRILVGWMGMSEASYTQNMTYSNGWTQAIAMPRLLTYKDHHIYQSPISQMKDLRQSHIVLDATQDVYKNGLCFELIMTNIDSQPLTIQFRHDCYLRYVDSILILDMGTCGDGRGIRYLDLDVLDKLHIFSDTSSLEIFINDGYYTMTTRIFSLDDQLIIYQNNSDIDYYELEQYQYI